MGIFPWNPEVRLLIAGLLWSFAGFALYYLISRQEGIAVRLAHRFPPYGIQAIQVLIQRACGLLFLGIITAVIILAGLKGSPADFGLSFQFSESPPAWSYALIPATILISYLMASSPVNLTHYPQIRSETWTRGLLWLSAVSWVVFLVAYEFLFRGFLLFSTISVLNPLTAISVNVVLYACAHFYKGPLEVIGAIPVGIVFCILTLATGNIWSAVVLHCVMALSNEWFSLMAHPSMKLRRT